MFWLMVAGAFAPGAAAGGSLKVLTSFVPVYSLTANVAGNLATVENLLPGNVDPHDYQLSPRDLAKLQWADVVVINGLALEDWLLDKLKSERAGHLRVIVELAGGLKSDQLIYDSEASWARPSRAGSRGDKGKPNPHIWLDPRLAEHGVSNICQALQRADPANAAGYARNAAACSARLGQLDDEMKTATDKFTHRDIVTDHNGFAYLARRYGLNIVGVVEEVDEVPPSPRQLARLEDAIRARRINVIFASPPLADRQAKQVAADAGIGLATLNTLEAGPLEAATYEHEMRENLAILEKSLR